MSDVTQAGDVPDWEIREQENREHDRLDATLFGLHAAAAMRKESATLVARRSGDADKDTDEGTET